MRSPLNLITVEEYLKLEQGAEIRHENESRNLSSRQK